MVVDASVALKWYLVDEPLAEEATAILRSADVLIAPELVIAETCNAAWRGVRVGRIDPTQAAEIARSLPQLFATLIGSSALAERAMAIALTLDHVVYDCFYLAAAEASALPLITADSRLLTKVRNTVWARIVLRLADQPTATS